MFHQLTEITSSNDDADTGEEQQECPGGHDLCSIPALHLTMHFLLSSSPTFEHVLVDLWTDTQLSHLAMANFRVK